MGHDCDGDPSSPEPAYQPRWGRAAKAPRAQHLGHILHDHVLCRVRVEPLEHGPHDGSGTPFVEAHHWNLGRLRMPFRRGAGEDDGLHPSMQELQRQPGRVVAHPAGARVVVGRNQCNSARVHYFPIANGGSASEPASNVGKRVPWKVRNASTVEFERRVTMVSTPRGRRKSLMKCRCDSPALDDIHPTRGVYRKPFSLTFTVRPTSLPPSDASPAGSTSEVAELALPTPVEPRVEKPGVGTPSQLWNARRVSASST